MVGLMHLSLGTWLSMLSHMSEYKIFILSNIINKPQKSLKRRCDSIRKKSGENVTFFKVQGKFKEFCMKSKKYFNIKVGEDYCLLATSFDQYFLLLAR